MTPNLSKKSSSKKISQSKKTVMNKINKFKNLQKIKYGGALYGYIILISIFVPFGIILTYCHVTLFYL